MQPAGHTIACINKTWKNRVADSDIQAGATELSNDKIPAAGEH
jgi:hypothetical protein